jgi:hypothetical protein
MTQNTTQEATTENNQDKSNDIKIDLKSELFAQFAAHYHAITSQIQRLPIHQGLKSIILTDFYHGFLGAKEAYFTMNVESLSKEPCKDPTKEPTQQETNGCAYVDKDASGSPCL